MPMSSRRESRLFKTCSRTSPSKRSRRRRGNFLGGFFQTRTLQRDPAVALFYSRTHKGGTEKKLNWISMTHPESQLALSREASVSTSDILWGKLPRKTANNSLDIVSRSH